MRKVFRALLLGASIIMLGFGLIWLASVVHANQRIEQQENQAVEAREAQLEQLELPTTTQASTTTTTTVLTTTTTPATTAVRPSSTTTTSTTLPPRPPAREAIGVNEVFGTVRISRLTEHWVAIGDQEVQTLARGDEYDLDASLEGGLVWQPSTHLDTAGLPANDLGLPGEGKTVVILGHRGGSDYKKVFGRLHELQLGDRVEVTTEWGVFTYEVTTLAAPSNTSLMMAEMLELNDSGQENLLLYSCVPGRAERLVVRGVLVEAVWA